ncbi:MAG: hypothetical protein AAF532_09825 [Planctomycetota bacterium]
MDVGRYRFERFTEAGKNFSPRVTLRQNGQIGFNEGARNAYSIEDRKYAVLFYDNANAAIGILLTNDESEEGALPVRQSKTNTYIAAKSFLDKHRVDYSKATRLTPEQHGDVLVLQLDSAEIAEEEKPQPPEPIER